MLTKCFSGNDYNSHCQYLCTVGFVLKGDDQRLCKADGRWTGDRPHCEQVCEDKYYIVCVVQTSLNCLSLQITCGVLKGIPRGRIRCTDEDRYNSECSYYCNSGFSISGSLTRRCLETGKWSGDEPECHRVSCPALSPPDHGSMSCNDGSHHNSSCDGSNMIKLLLQFIRVPIEITFVFNRSNKDLAKAQSNVTSALLWSVQLHDAAVLMVSGLERSHFVNGNLFLKFIEINFTL